MCVTVVHSYCCIIFLFLVPDILICLAWHHDVWHTTRRNRVCAHMYAYCCYLLQFPS